MWSLKQRKKGQNQLKFGEIEKKKGLRGQCKRKEHEEEKTTGNV